MNRCECGEVLLKCPECHRMTCFMALEGIRIHDENRTKMSNSLAGDYVVCPECWVITRNTESGLMPLSEDEYVLIPFEILKAAQKVRQVCER